MLLRVCREGDSVSRIGDCTFGVVLDNVSSPVLQQLAAEKIVRLYKAVVSEIDASYTPRISIGVASFGDSSNDEEGLIQVADQNLYRAKHDGRNRVVAEVPND